MGKKIWACSGALLIENMNASKLEAQNPIKTLFNHPKNLNSYSDSATPVLEGGAEYQGLQSAKAAWLAQRKRSPTSELKR